MTTHDERLIDPEDRAYVRSLTDDGARDVVVASLQRHRAPETLVAGDPMPDGSLHAVELDRVVRLRDLCRGRPVLLVFGSYT